MTTLNQYLEDIAVAVLRPLGYLYAKQGATEGTIGYCGLHAINSHDKMWDKWVCVTILDLSVAIPDQILPFEGYKGTCTLYRLYWITEWDGRQASWWVKDEQL